MNKKFLSAVLFGALMVSSTGTFVSCKDYDDDIENLQGQITDNATAIAALEAQIKSGKWVQGVTSTADGIVVTLGDGSTYPITNGEKGQDGITPKIAVNNGKIQVSYDNGTTWTDLISLDELKGETGAAAESPIFSVGEDGHIYVQYGENGEKKDLGVSTGGIYYVEQGAKLTLHVPNKAGEYNDIVLPRAAAISSIKAVTVNEENDKATLTDGAVVKLTYGIATADGKYLNGTAFKKGDILLPTKEANAVVSAQVNPTIADATIYDFYLANSKSESIFALTSATPNMTENALSREDKEATRAATANKGIYDMGVTFASGVTQKQVNNANGTYAIATKDAYDNEVLSAYDVQVTATKATNSNLTVSKQSVEVEVNKDFDLNSCVDMTNVIDVKYEFPTGQQAAVDAAKAEINGTKIKGSVANKQVKVKVIYLDYNGTKQTVEPNITVQFINPVTEHAFTQELTLNADKSKNVLTFDVTSLIGNTVASASDFFKIGEVKFTADVKDQNTDKEYKKGADAVGFIAPISVSSASATTPANGYYKHSLTYSVENSKVIPGTYEAELTYGTAPINTVKLTLIVKENVVSYNFKPLDLYFAGNNATAYGTPNESDKIEYNLTGLFGVTEWDNVTFTETVPQTYKDDEGITWTANAWLQTGETAELGDIVVDKVASKNAETKTGNFGGAYKARDLKATYVPYANKNLTATEYDFNLTIKSAVFEGSLDYVKLVNKVYVAGDPKTIKVAEAGAKATLKSDEIRGITKTGVTYFGNKDLTKAHVEGVTVALEGDNAKQYLDIDKKSFDEDGITITPKANVTIPADGKSVTCYVRVSVLDAWGKTKTVDVPVVLK